MVLRRISLHCFHFIGACIEALWTITSPLIGRQHPEYSHDHRLSSSVLETMFMLLGTKNNPLISPLLCIPALVSLPPTLVFQPSTPLSVYYKAVSSFRGNTLVVVFSLRHGCNSHMYCASKSAVLYRRAYSCVRSGSKASCLLQPLSKLF